MKKILIGLGGLVALGLILVFLWIGINVWAPEPPLGPPLWTARDLPLPGIVGKNGWEMIPRGRREPRWNKELPYLSEWYDLKRDWEKKGVDAFWKEVPALVAALTPLERDRETALLEYQAILNAPSFVDVTPFESVPEKPPNLLYLKDLHEIGLMSVFIKAFQEEWDEAYALLEAILQTDSYWARSARTPLSHTFSLSFLREDLVVFKTLTQKGDRPEAARIREFLGSMNLSSFSYKTALAYEYLYISFTQLGNSSLFLFRKRIIQQKSGLVHLQPGPL